jgi:benzoate membrane transport protein
MAGLSFDQTSSWVCAIAIFSGVGSIFLSARYKMPLLMAMNTPVAALLVGAISPTNFNEVIGAALMAGVVIFMMGQFGWFAWLTQHIPQGMVGALLAGVLFRFSADLFVQMSLDFKLVTGIFFVFILTRRFLPRYAVLVAFIAGLIGVILEGKLPFNTLHWSAPVWVWNTPQFSVHGFVNFSLPFIALALCGQYMPGLALLKTHRYYPSPDPLLKTGGLLSVMSAPFGAHGVVLAAVAAAMSVEPHAHKNHQRRYLAAVYCGVFCVLIGVGGVALVSLFLSLPMTFIAAISGVAMFSAIQNGLLLAFETPSERKSALITLVVAVSGMKLFGLAAPFWALVFGLSVHYILNFRKKA